MTLNVSGRSFEEELAAYLTWLRDLPDMRDLSWTRVVVVENDFLRRGGEPEPPEPSSFDVSARGARAFESRFERILASAARGWVNLRAKTIVDDVLVVEIEWAGEGGRDKPVFVNWGGMMRGEIDRLRPPEWRRAIRRLRRRAATRR